MTYSVQNTDGSRTINVAASQVNSSFSVALVGRNVSGYGQFFVQNSIRHLENFASTSAPSDDILLTGQIWYDKNEDVMRVYDGTAWRRMSITVRSSDPSGGVDEGTAYFNTTDDKLKVFDGASFVDASYAGKVSSEFSSDADVGNPGKYGTRLRTMYIPNTSGKYHAVIALMYVSDGSDRGVTDGETVMAIFSDHTDFEISTSLPFKVEGLGDVQLYNEFVDSDGIGSTIKAGMNLRNKYAGTAVSLANVALQADVANAINTGSGNINGAFVFTANSSALIPDQTDTVTLGNTTNRFSSLYIDTIEIGDPNSTAAQYIRKANVGGVTSVILDIGESTAPIDNIHVSNIILADGGKIQGLNIETFGTSSAPIDLAYMSNIVVGANVGITTLGFTGDVLDSGGNVIVSEAGGATAQLSQTQTFTGINTFSNDILASGAPDIGTSGSKFGTIHSSTFNGTTLTLSGSATSPTFNGNLSGTSATLTGTVSGGDGTFTGIVSFGSLRDTGENITVTKFVDQADGISSNDNDTTIPTSAAVKAYVDAQVTAQDLDFQADSGGALSIDLDSEVLDIAGGTNINTVGSGNQVTVNLDTALTGLTSASFSGTVSANLFDGVASSAKYADLAEIYASDEDYEPGTVVKIGGSAEITKTDKHADTDVFGVISTNPAYLMNKDAAGLPVAMTGRVPVRVVGKVKKGERLVSSDVPGVAWALGEDIYDPRAVIGRSLEDKEDGDLGLVEAVIGVK